MFLITQSDNITTIPETQPTFLIDNISPIPPMGNSGNILYQYSLSIFSTKINNKLQQNFISKCNNYLNNLIPL